VWQKKNSLTLLVGMSIGATTMKNSLDIPCTVLCLVSLLCPTLYDPMDCSPPGPSVHEDSPGKNTGEGSYSLLQGIFLIQGLNSSLPHCRQILCCLIHQGIHYAFSLAMNDSSCCSIVLTFSTGNVSDFCHPNWYVVISHCFNFLHDMWCDNF